MTKLELWNKEKSTCLPKCEICKAKNYEMIFYKPKGGLFGHTLCKKCFVGDE